MSLHEWNLISPMSWVGLENYRNLLTNPGTASVFTHTLLYVVGYLPLVYVGGLALAMLLNQKLRGRSFLRAAYFLPVVTSWVLATPLAHHLAPAVTVHVLRGRQVPERAARPGGGERRAGDGKAHPCAVERVFRVPVRCRVGLEGAGLGDAVLVKW